MMKKGKILEFDIGNIMIEEEGTYYTPSYDNDFLLGMHASISYR